MSRARTPPVYTDVTRFALRRPGHPGWVMVVTTHYAETLPHHLPELDLSPDECRRLLTYSTPKRVARPIWLTGDDAYVFLMGSGWCFDERAACWRAPNEAVTEPPGRPPEVEALRVAPGDWLDGAAPRDPSKPERDRDEEGMYDFLPFRSVRVEAALGLPERRP